VDPLLPLYFTRTAYVDQNERRWNAALGNFERAKHAGELRDLDAVTAPILEQLGDLNKAHRAYEAALRRDPANAALRAGAARTAR
jgi:cytochrome c-type biogenesis protein CcmH/NrfG